MRDRLPRGVRNNNPGNIDYNPKNNWEGQTGIETGVPYPRFAKFSRAEYGIRAICKILMSYQRQGFKSVEQMISRWAPHTENNTSAYVDAVSARVGLRKNEPVPLTAANLEILVKAIVYHENGYNPYPDSIYNDGIQRAL